MANYKKKGNTSYQSYGKENSKRLVRRVIYLAVIAVIALAVTYFEGFMDDLQNESSVPANIEVSEDVYYDWDENTAPEYYYVVGKANVENEPKAGEVKTSKLDSKGRTRGVSATVTYDMVEESRGWRESFGSDDNPSGWGNNSEVEIELSDGSYYRGWFWNRSHLLADSLGGHADRNNVVTGTRMQNVGSNKSNNPGGMAYTETKARDWLYANHDGTVYYSAEPVYKGSELIPRSVIVNVKSSDGSIDECVIVYNYAKGYNINYKTGEFSHK